MAFLLEKFYFGKTLIFVLVTIYLCDAKTGSVMTQFNQTKIVATSYKTLQNIYNIQCEEICNNKRQTGLCSLAEFNITTQACFLSVDDLHDVLNTGDAMTGVYFFKQEQAGIINILFII